MGGTGGKEVEEGQRTGGRRGEPDPQPLSHAQSKYIKGKYHQVAVIE